jgi:hypothetical protein
MEELFRLDSTRATGSRPAVSGAALPASSSQMTWDRGQERVLVATQAVDRGEGLLHRPWRGNSPGATGTRGGPFGAPEEFDT